MVTEHEKLKFRYFSFLFITGVLVLLDTIEYIYIYVVKAPLKAQYKQL